jgi:hypothetical protein
MSKTLISIDDPVLDWMPCWRITGGASMRAFSLSRRKSKIVTAFAVIVMVVSTVAVKFSLHPFLWLVETIALIPICAAIVGAPEDHHNDPG